MVLGRPDGRRQLSGALAESSHVDDPAPRPTLQPANQPNGCNAGTERQTGALTIARPPRTRRPQHEMGSPTHHCHPRQPQVQSARPAESIQTGRRIAGQASRQAGRQAGWLDEWRNNWRVPTSAGWLDLIRIGVSVDRAQSARPSVCQLARQPRRRTESVARADKLTRVAWLPLASLFAVAGL